MPITLHGKQYITVAERLIEFHAKYPKGAIRTSMEYPDEKTVRCKAVVSPDVETKRFFTGHAEEKRDAPGVNRTSAVENAETSAVGRALANLGIAIESGVASADEIASANHRQETSVYTLKPEVSKKKKICVTCGAEHNGKYSKCIDCWRKDNKPKA